jgi:hypothetical protein
MTRLADAVPRLFGPFQDHCDISETEHERATRLAALLSGAPQGRIYDSEQGRGESI